MTRKRLLEIDGWDPFELLDLGGHDRRHWHQVAFGGDHTGSLARPGGSARRCAAHEYRAYLVRCYGGQPVPGRRYVHGEKGPALIHVGPVDSPVTLRDIRQAIAECARLGRAELHVLGWEWEMASAPPEGIRCPGGPTRDEARRQGLKLALLQIPREVTDQPAASPSPFAFVELACPKVAVRHRGGLRVDVALTDFVFPTADLIPQEVQAKITKWSDYIDSWAVDWDFQEDAFHPAWASYRTPRDRTLALHSDPHTYRKPGKYQIAVKVTDIFGCDVLHAQFVPKALWEDG